jgi:hypothetical protein
VMSKKKPTRDDKAVWRIRGTDGKWKELSDGECPDVTVPGYMWTPCIQGNNGLRILNFILN